MLDAALRAEAEASAVEGAVERVLADGFRTKDILEEGESCVGTARWATLIAERV